MEIPSLNWPKYQEYIIHFDNCVFAELITNKLSEVYGLCNKEGKKKLLKLKKKKIYMDFMIIGFM